MSTIIIITPPPRQQQKSAHEKLDKPVTEITVENTDGMTDEQILRAAADQLAQQT